MKTADAIAIMALMNDARVQALAREYWRQVIDPASLRVLRMCEHKERMDWFRSVIRRSRDGWRA